MAIVEGFHQHRTKDIGLASALLACGIPPIEKEPATFTAGDHNYTAFNVGPASLDGMFTTRELMKAWEDWEQFIADNPEHPFAYCIAFWRNYQNLVEYARKTKPKLFVHRGRSVAVIDPDDAPEITDHLLGKLGL